MLKNSGFLHAFSLVVSKPVQAPPNAEKLGFSSHVFSFVVSKRHVQVPYYRMVLTLLPESKRPAIRPRKGKPQGGRGPAAVPSFPHGCVMWSATVFSICFFFFFLLRFEGGFCAILHRTFTFFFLPSFPFFSSDDITQPLLRVRNPYVETFSP
jgi:hypothetical protein